MQINAAHTNAYQPNYATKAASDANSLQANLKSGEGAKSETRQAFDQFVGQTFFSQLLGEMRKSVGKPAYMHGGRAEEVFQGQLDQMLAERMTEASAESFTGPMFELFMLGAAK